MFTEGLDETALNWVREGVDVNPTLYSSENISPNLATDPLIYDAALLGKTRNWGLPATKLPGIHYHSGFLGPPHLSSHLEGSVVLDVDDDESVGSAPERGLYYSSGEDGDSAESDLQENPLLHHDYRGGVGQGGYMSGGHLKSPHETTYEYKCRYRYDRLQTSNLEPVSVMDSWSSHCGAKRKINPQHGESVVEKSRFPYGRQHPCSGAGSSEDIGSPEEFPRKNGENAAYHQAEKCTQSGTSPEGKRQEDKKETDQSSICEDRAWPPECDVEDQVFHIPDPQPRSLSEAGTPSAPPMFEPATEITEEGAAKTESKTSRQQRSRESIPIDDINMDQMHFSAPESKDKCTRPASEEVEVQASCRKTSSFFSPPAFYVSGHGAWQALLAYEACVRLCLRAWATGCMEAPEFLNDECAVLRSAFGLQKILLQPEEELLRNATISGSIEETSAPRLKRTVEKIKVEVHRVKIKLVVPSSCNFPCAGPILEHFKSLGKYFSNMWSDLLAGWAAVRTVHSVPHAPRPTTHSQRGAMYMQAGSQYVRQFSGMIKAGVNTLRNSTPSETTQETFSCFLQLKSLIEEEASLMQPGSAVWMQPGSGDNHIFFPESQGDVLIVEVQNSKGNPYGRSSIKIASITDDPNDKIRWWPIYNEKHDCVGKVQLSITNLSTSGEMRPTKCGPVGETLAYDLVLEAAMRMQNFQSRNLCLQGPWKWLLTEFASYYGVSDSYTKLRYLSCIMDVATPTKDCFDLLYELLVPIIKARDENTLNRQEKRMLADCEDQLQHLLATAFENYKSLDESSPSGLVDMFGLATGIAAPALAPAVQVYTLLHDILSAEAQATLRNYLQMAARKRCKRHMAETDEFMMSNNDGFLMDSLTISTAYLKMKALCMHIRDEVHTDIEIHNQHILPSSVDLPTITASVYNVELCNRLRSFLVACPPSSPSSPVTELLIATADFQRDLASWNIRPIKGGVDSKDLFHLYIVLWIQDKRLYLLDFCKLDKVRLTETTTQRSTSPFVEEMYERIKDTLNEYEAIINRWPEYSIDLENAITTVERAVMGALEKQYAEVLTPLKDGIIPKKFGLQYMQKLTRRNSVCLYSVPCQLGLFLNTIKRILDALHPKFETQLRSWASCLPTPVAGDRKLVFGEQLNGITVMLRTKYKTFLQAIVEKLADNTRVQRTTKLKRILQDTKEAGGENEIRERMQLLNSQLIDTICHLHDIFASRIFVAICRGFWDRMGQDVLYFLENRKENRSWYKGSCFALGILDDTFASQMQRLQGNALQEKDLDPPRSIMEARSMLCRETPHGADSSSYYYL
ncbi:hypothetical protein KI387_027452 [Taxus chinensis]|uniref:Uncharacterized protein n=1 Tax=Taxus chinensis TaxID=29808 RepID=A0AA38FXQ9_TAXCH|nr:hypothetical protein KI387_027452 [Taxus chinensis]